MQRNRAPKGRAAKARLLQGVPGKLRVNNMKRRSNQKRLLVGLALVFGLMLFVAFLLLASADQENKNSALVVHTRDVLDRIDETLTAVVDAENGRRGYIISGDGRYESHFADQAQRAYRLLGQVRDLTVDNPIQTQACDSLLPLIRQRFTIATNSIQARRQIGLDALAQTAFIEQGQQTMEAILRLSGRMRDRESLLLKQRLDVQDKNIKGVEAFAALLGIFGLALFVVLLVLFWRADVRRRAAEEALNQTNMELEQRVQERTAELSESQERVAQEKNLLRNVIDNLPIHIYLKDPEGHFLVSNAANAHAMNASSESETIGKTVFDFFPESTAKLYQNADQEALAAETAVIDREIETRNLAGQPQWLLTTRVPLRDSHGNIGGLLGISQDITERKRSEEMRTRLAAIVEASDDAIFSATLEGVITSWNPGAERLFGYSAQEAIGGRLPGFVPSETGDEKSSILQRVARGESIHRVETQLLKKDGAVLEVALTISPIKDSDGRVHGASEIARDITQSKEAERKLRTQLARLDLLSRTTKAIAERQDLASIFQVVLHRLEDDLPVDFACFCRYDAKAPSLSVASIGSKSFGLGQTLAMAEQAHIGIDENGLSRCVHGELVYEPDITQVDFPFPRRLAAGGLGSLVIAPLLVESEVLGLLVAARRQPSSFSSSDCEFLRQLSEHVALAAHHAELNGALQRAYDDLRKTQQVAAQQERLRALGQMASGIAHDINNALSPVALYSESMLEQEPNLSARAREQLQTICSAIADVSETVARMREFYRQREPQLDMMPVQLNDLLQQVINLTQARWSDMPLQQGVVIEQQSELAAGLPQIMGVESEIREALTNLILNAVDAMPTGGRLTIRSRVFEGQNIGSPVNSVYVEITDTGIGMDEETQRRCMEPFFTTKGERGTGLGLAMVYGMTRRHSAELEIESSPGEGTTMRLVFPVPDARMPLVGGARTVHVAPSRLRVLVVDDDPMLLKSLTDVLETDGHTVVAANGGQTGIDIFSAHAEPDDSFDVVITDLGMPYIDGRRVAAAVKGASPATPVILLTGWGKRLMENGGVPEHVDRVLSKPPRIAELRAALAQCTPSPK